MICLSCGKEFNPDGHQVCLACATSTQKGSSIQTAGSYEERYSARLRAHREDEEAYKETLEYKASNFFNFFRPIVILRLSAALLVTLSIIFGILLGSIPKGMAASFVSYFLVVAMFTGPVMFSEMANRSVLMIVIALIPISEY